MVGDHQVQCERKKVRERHSDRAGGQVKLKEELAGVGQFYGVHVDQRLVDDDSN